jgi:hypothetical protein
MQGHRLKLSHGYHLPHIFQIINHCRWILQIHDSDLKPRYSLGQVLIFLSFPSLLVTSVRTSLTLVPCYVPSYFVELLSLRASFDLVLHRGHVTRAAELSPYLVPLTDCERGKKLLRDTLVPWHQKKCVSHYAPFRHEAVDTNNHIA